MPTWLKVLLGIVAFVFALVAVGIFFAYRWFQSNAPELRQKVESVAAEGEQFAKGRDANACVDEALARADRAGGFMDQVTLQMFLTSCLQHAAPSPELCANVPAPGELRKTMSWSAAECARRGRPNSQACGQLLGAIQQHCHKE